MADAALKDIDSLLAIIRKPGSAKEIFAQAVPWFNKYLPTPLWKKIVSIDIDRDILLAKTWIEEQLNSPKFPKRTITGLYFGLDTLNMNDGLGHNIEIGGSDKFKLSSPSKDWPYENCWYGEKHLIEGLLEMTDLTKKNEYDFRWFVEYYVWMTYSGLILKQIFESSDAATLLTGAPARHIMWGHHDGDLCSLGILKPSGFAIDVTF